MIDALEMSVVLEGVSTRPLAIVPHAREGALD
jgi:hypothetical protein